MNTDTRPIGIFDLTRECPLRCRHCYYYTNATPAPAELHPEEFLTKLQETRDRYGIRSAFWVGGEPLLEPDLLRRAMEFFPRNAVATSGALPIPRDLDAGLLVSIEGPREAHDAVRGEGSFDTAMTHVGRLAAGSFALATTFTSTSVDYIDALPALVSSTRALGVLVGFHVGLPGDPERMGAGRRDRAVDTLLDMHDRYPGVLLHSKHAIELFRSCHSREVAKKCIYRDTAIAFDVCFGVKTPCTFLENAACDACGCPVVVAHAAWRSADEKSHALLHALFPKRRAA